LGRRNANLSRLENKKLTDPLQSKSWDELSKEEKKLVKSAYDEDFFTNSWYINKDGNKINRASLPKAVEEATGQNDWTEGTSFRGDKTWTKTIDNKEVQVMQTGPQSFVASNADATGSPSNTFRTLQDAKQAASGNALATPAKEEKPAVETDEVAKAKQDLEDALGDLAWLATKSTRLNMLPEKIKIKLSIFLFQTRIFS
jgi:hypothetical protein